MPRRPPRGARSGGGPFRLVNNRKYTNRNTQYVYMHICVYVYIYIYIYIAMTISITITITITITIITIIITITFTITITIMWLCVFRAPPRRSRTWRPEIRTISDVPKPRYGRPKPLRGPLLNRVSVFTKTRPTRSIPAKTRVLPKFSQGYIYIYISLIYLPYNMWYMIANIDLCKESPGAAPSSLQISLQG